MPKRKDADCLLRARLVSAQMKELQDTLGECVAANRPSDDAIYKHLCCINDDLGELVTLLSETRA
jgi:hypothetical protein